MPIEALRQFALEVGKDNVCFIHVTLLPYIKAAGEVKTKPTQQSVAKLRELAKPVVEKQKAAANPEVVKQLEAELAKAQGKS